MRRALLACLLPVVATAWSCLAPTEIMVTITSNTCALQRADVYVDGFQVSSTKPTGCDQSNPFAHFEVGTINILPSHGIDSAVDIAIVGAVGDACTTPDTQELQCIVARRSLSFIPHKRLDLPIVLDGACAGRNCPGQTCVVDSTGAHCVGSTCGVDTVPCEVDGGGGGGSTDGAPADVIVVDAGPPACPALFPAPVGPPTFSWSFEATTTDGLLHEDKDLVAPAPSMAVTSSLSSSPPTFCNRYLKPSSSQALLTQAAPISSKLQTANFTVGVAYVAKADGIILQLPSSAQFGGFDIGVSGSHLVVRFNSPGTTIVFQGTAPVTDGLWHRFAMDVETSAGSVDGGQPVTVLQPYVEGVALKSFVTPSPYVPASAGLFVGGIGGVDQVVFYSN